MNLLKSLFIGSWFLISTTASSFVLISGPEKAILDVSANEPEITFLWNGTAPSLKDVEEFENGIYVGKTDEEIMEEIINKALSLWNNVPGSYINLKMEVDANVSADAEDKTHALVVKSIDNLATAAFALPSNEEGIIYDCDITISKTKVSAESLAYTIAHEMGHCLGLGHPHTNYGAMMGYSREDRKLELGADDMAGLIYLYPDPKYGAESPKELISCGTVKAGKTEQQIWLSLLLFIPILAAILYQLRKRDL